MREPEDDAPVDENLTSGAEIHRNAWQRTIDDMSAMATELREGGWDTVVEVVAGDTAPVPPGDDGRFGLVHVVPGNDAERIDDVYEPGSFPKYDVFRAEAEGRVFLVTQLLDPETDTAILVAGNFERRTASTLVEHVREVGEMYTHLQKLDGTPVSSFRHDGYEKFFPEADRLVDTADDGRTGE